MATQNWHDAHNLPRFTETPQRKAQRKRDAAANVWHDWTGHLLAANHGPAPACFCVKTPYVIVTAPRAK